MPKIKKIIAYFFLIFFIFENVNAKSYKIGDKISGEMEFYKKYKFELPSGTWIVADRFRYSYYGANAKGYSLLKIKGNKAIEVISIAELDIGARFQGAFNDAMHLVMFKNEYDGCYDRPEYYILEYFTKGSSHNCFWISHEDVYKELFDPDDPELRGVNAQYKAWLRDNKIELPKIAITKGKNRNAGDETFFHENKIIKFKKNDPTLFFLQRLRDEAHRFAISTHRAKRRKNLSKSLLDQISGIGRSRKRALLNHFGSAKSVEAASFEDLKSVDGIEEKVAKKIHDFFHED